MKKLLLIVAAGLLLASCGGSGATNCHEARFVHLDGTWEYILICDEDRPFYRCYRTPVIDTVIEDNSATSSYRLEEVCYPVEARPMEGTR